jgi:glycerol uptake facilitator-like aquaporin
MRHKLWLPDNERKPSPAFSHHGDGALASWFTYVFFGCGTRILVGGGQDAASRLLVYFTFGFALLALTYALGHFSGAPFNPATTLGFALARRFPWRYLLPYWFFQVIGALAASTVLFFLLSSRAAHAQYAATIPTVGVTQAVGRTSP